MELIEKIDNYLDEGIKDTILKPLESVADFLLSIDYGLSQRRINKHVTMTWDKKKIKQLKKMENQFKKNLKKELGPDWKKIADKSILKDLSQPTQDLHKKIWDLHYQIYG